MLSECWVFTSQFSHGYQCNHWLIRNGNPIFEIAGPKQKTPTRPSPELPMEVIDPPYCFNIADFAQINLGCWQVRMPEQHLWNDFNRCSGPGCICGSVLPQIMRLQIDANQFASIFHDQSGCGICKRENPCILLNAIVSNIFLETIYHFLWQENHLGFPAAFGVSDHNFATCAIRNRTVVTMSYWSL